MSSILIYTEGGTFGLGHVVRCIHLARALGQYADVSFISPLNETIGIERLRQAGYFVNRDFIDADAIIVDVEQYPGVDFMKSVREKYRRVILVGGVSYPPADELAPFVDLQIYQGELFDHPPGPTAINGPEYLIVDPLFSQCVPKRDGHILISMGGRDPEGFTGHALNLLSLSHKTITVIGPANKFEMKDYPRETNIVKAPASIVPYVNGAALAVVTTGMTAYECFAAGVPCVLFNISPDHERTAAGLQMRGCAYNTGHDLNPYQFPYQFMTLVYSALALFEPMSAAGRALVDGQGAARVAERIWHIMA